MVQRICVSKKLKFVSAAKVGKSKMVGKEKCLRNASLFLNTNVLRAPPAFHIKDSAIFRQKLQNRTCTSAEDCDQQFVFQSVSPQLYFTLSEMIFV